MTLNQQASLSCMLATLGVGLLTVAVQNDPTPLNAPFWILPTATACCAGCSFIMLKLPFSPSMSRVQVTAMQSALLFLASLSLILLVAGFGALCMQADYASNPKVIPDGEVQRLDTSSTTSRAPCAPEIPSTSVDQK